MTSMNGCRKLWGSEWVVDGLHEIFWYGSDRCRSFTFMLVQSMIEDTRWNVVSCVWCFISYIKGRSGIQVPHTQCIHMEGSMEAAYRRNVRSINTPLLPGTRRNDSRITISRHLCDDKGFVAFKVSSLSMEAEA
jgi:hypothetical protein